MDFVSNRQKIKGASKDNYLVALAIDSNADFLITGENDLLELNKIGNTIVIKFSDFDKVIKE